MLFLLLNVLIQTLEAEKLPISGGAEMCKPFSLKWVPSVEALLSHDCLNYAASADSISFSGKPFDDFHYLEKGLHG
jgi:hypothetical protein